MKKFYTKTLLIFVLSLLTAGNIWADAVALDWDASTLTAIPNGYSNKLVNLTLKNKTFTAGQWTMVCFPFNVSKSVLDATFTGGYEVQQFSSMTGNTFNFTKVTGDSFTLNAGTPYAFRSNSTVENAVFCGVTLTGGTEQKISYDEDAHFLKGMIYQKNGNDFNWKSNKCYDYMMQGSSILKVCEWKAYPGISAYFETADLTQPMSVSLEGYTVDTSTLDLTDTDNLNYAISKKVQLTDVPTIYINIPKAEGQDLNTVVTKAAGYFNAYIQLIDNSETGTEQHLTSFADSVEIKVRGNSTALQAKRPYRLKFAKKHKHDMLGLGYEKRNWTLLANFLDPSLIRNALTYRLNTLIGESFCPGYKFVDLVVNNEYRGTYQISDHVEVDADRINVDESTGWYLECARADMVEEPSVTAAGMTMSIKNPEPTTAEDTLALKNSVNDWYTNWAAIMDKYSSDATTFRNPTNGWRSLTDENTLVQLYTAINFSGDYDGFMTVKMYREADGKLFFGPIWDKDLAYGNYDDGSTLVENMENGLFKGRIQQVWTDPVFMKKLHDKIKSLVDDGIQNDLLSYVDKLAGIVKNTQKLDSIKWPASEKQTFSKLANYTPSQAIVQLKEYLGSHLTFVQGKVDEQYEALGGSSIVDNTDDDPDTPSTSSGALVDLGNGEYKFTGSSSSFVEGTKITITTADANSTVNSYVVKNSAWSSSKTITLTASDITALADSSYAFHMTTTGEVIAVNVKIPEQSGLVYNENTKKWGASDENDYTYTFKKSDVVVGAKLKITLSGDGAYFMTYLTNQYTQYSNFSSDKTLELTLTQADVNEIIASNYVATIVTRMNGTITNVTLTSSSSSTPITYSFALASNPTAGGTITGAPAGSYEEGTYVLVKATPADGYTFTKWSDESTSASHSIFLSKDTTLTAYFTESSLTRKQLTDVPTIYIDTNTETGVTDDWKKANIEVFDSAGKLNGGTTWTVDSTAANTMYIQYQGSGTAGSKNSYRLKFDTKRALIGSKEYKQWVLASNDDDPSMINNALTTVLGDNIGMPFTPRYQFVDLYINNEYQGTYQLTDRIKVESGRALVSGGNKDNDWLVQFDDDGEIEENSNSTYINSTNTTPNIVVKNPDPDDLTTAQIATLQQTMSDWFIGTNDGTNFFKNVEANVDKEQFINWYIAMEILCSYKGLSSIEAYKLAAANGTLHMGPLWDSEKAFGNAPKHPVSMDDLNTTGSYDYLITEYSDYKVMRHWLKNLWLEKWFAEGVLKKWKTLYGDSKTIDLKSILENAAENISASLSQTQEQNVRKWTSSLGSYTTYTAAVAAISTYLENRFSYLDAKFKELAAWTETEGTLPTLVFNVKKDDALVAWTNADGKNVNVQLKNRGTITGGKWNLICLPFALDASGIASVFGTGTKVMSFTSATTNGTIADFGYTEVNAMVASTPYLIKPAADVTNLTFSNVIFNANSPVTVTNNDYSFTGTLNAVDLTAASKPVIMQTDNSLGYLTADAEVRGCNGYFTVPSGSTVTTFTLPVDFILGDVNNDGEVNIEDVVAVIEYLNNNTALENPTAAEFDGSNGITINDLDKLVESILIAK